MKKRKGKWLRGNVSVFGKTVPVFVLAIALSAAVGFALLTTYVTTTGSADVEQSVVIDLDDDTGGCHLTWDDQSDDQCTDETETSALYSAEAVGGDTRDVGIRLRNRGETVAPVDVVVSGTVPDGAAWGTDVVVSLYGDYDPVDEECLGESLGTYASSGDSLPAGDVEAEGERWVCIRHFWVINAEPGDYSFSASVEPA